MIAGLWWGGGSIHLRPLVGQPPSFGLLKALGAASIPIAFAYGGWQTASFVAGEMRDPRRDLARGLVAGVLGVIALYLSANFVCVRVLGPAGLAETRTPASAVMHAALGRSGALFIAARHIRWPASFPRLRRFRCAQARILPAADLAAKACEDLRRCHRSAPIERLCRIK